MLEKLTSESPRNLEALYLLAIALSASGDLEKASQPLRKALEVDHPGFLPAIQNLSQTSSAWAISTGRSSIYENRTMRAYKFLNEKYGLKDIAEKQVKVSTFGDMNDPFELIGFQWSDEAVEGQLMSHHTSEYGAMCLSKNCTDPLLWAHYADKHRGVCLGFDVPDDPAQVHPVIYVNDREIQDPHIIYEAIQTQNPDIIQDPLMRKLLLKYEGWRYEDEVRLLKRLGPALTFLHFDDDDFTLKEVILGLRCRITKKAILNRLLGYNRPVHIFKTSLSKDKFEIQAEPI